METITQTIRQTARGGARSVVTAVGQLSAPMRMKPTFIIAGAQRCATTSIFRMLAQHPQVQPPALNKGIHYFDTAERFRRGPNYYLGHFPLNTAYRRPPRITGEGSPYYLFHPLAISRIAAQLPEVKLLVLLRDPVERAFSAYKQETMRGFEDLTFEDALKAEGGRLRHEEERIVTDPGYQSFSHQHHAYVARGRYAVQLERAFSIMGRERVMVIDADDFLVPGLPHWPALTDYLGISPWRPADVIRANARPSDAMPASLKDRLREQFQDDDVQLTKLLGHVPSWRR
ncbi:sulfotransferase family protein [Arthrobacter glacialis]|uniref:sulfotransferase family protein n=1 Tax=Arthrobacter glacialis TaxID=1664 RepID=UPI0010572444|nr:sulfotransferase [Arthrobacter glacialis]